MEKYKLSFTAASLSLSESIKIAEVYLQCNSWEETKEIVFRDNVLQSRTVSRTKRTYNELSQRLKTLSPRQLELLIDGTLEEQKHLLWFAICQLYSYLREFSIEIIREKFLSMNYELSDMDYISFFNRKADWHEELDSIAETTKHKLMLVTFRILKEVGIITEENFITQVFLSERLKGVLKETDSDFILIFPTYDE